MKDTTDIANELYEQAFEDAPEFSESDKDSEAEDLLHDEFESLGLAELCDILSATPKEMHDIEKAIFELAMNDEDVKNILIQKARVMYQDDIQKRLEILNDC